MGKNLGKIAYVDIKFEETIERFRESFKKIGIDQHLGERQMTKIIAEVIENLDFKITLIAKKRKDRFEVRLN